MAYRFSGHETFPCRYAWLPKAVKGLCDNPVLFSNMDDAMVTLGVGKNMVRAIRFWVEAAAMAEPSKNGALVVTPFGRTLLGECGTDPYLENLQTLWLIHWKFSTHINDPIFAWDFLMNRWQHPEIAPSKVLNAFEREATLQNRKLSNVTLRQHFDVFLHTYVPTRSIKGEVLEENLDSPLVELDLIRQVGERMTLTGKGKREPVYAFNRDAKPHISPELFIFCLNDFWEKRNPEENTLAFRELAVGHGSPGQVFKLPEAEIRDRLESIEEASRGMFSFQESVNLQQILRHKQSDSIKLLRAIYKNEVGDV